MSRTKPFATEVFLNQYESERPVQWSKRFSGEGPIDVEIGCGLGEFLTDYAGEHPGRNIIGIEQDWKRINRTLSRIRHLQQTQPGLNGGRNIRVMQIEARTAFERLFEPESIHRIYSLFPCPWPKKGHIKHRLFSADFLRLLNNRLVSDGQLLIVTDYLPYFEWVLEESTETGFSVSTQKIKPRFNTKFERKWMGAGQSEFYEAVFVKSQHVFVPLKEDAPLKIYWAQNFDPDCFAWEDIKQDVSVILKEFLYDRQRGKGMVHVVVAEEHITQHLWVIIKKDRKGWCITKAEGQSALPTEGVARAVYEIYKAADRTGV